MSDKYKIAVIVPTYNKAQLLEHTLYALGLQDYAKDSFEVIVADDGSADNTRSVTESFRGTMNIKYCFQEDKGYRPASARNMGIRNANSEICLFLDTGILLGENSVDAHVKCHESNTADIVALGYIYAYGANADPQSEDLCKRMIDFRQPGDSIDRIKRSGMGEDVRNVHYVKYNYDLDKIPAPWIFCWSGNMSVKQEKLEQVGGFDTCYDGRWGCEDIDLGIRLQHADLKFRICRDAASVHFPEKENKLNKLKEGLTNCAYLHSKFDTTATRLFYEYYLKEDDRENNCPMTDINEFLKPENA